MGGNITRVLGVFNVIGCKEETWEVRNVGGNITRVLGVFNVIGCKEEMWEVTSHEFWGYLM